MWWRICNDGAPLENTARDYLANLHVQAAVYRSHQEPGAGSMAQFDPDHAPMSNFRPVSTH